MAKEGIKELLQACGLEPLNDAHDAEGIETALAKLNGLTRDMSNVRRQLVADAARKHLRAMGVEQPSALVRAALTTAPVEPTKPTRFQAIVPASYAVDLFARLVTFIERFLVLPRWGALKIALWVVYAHAYDCFDYSPLLIATSAEKGSGKSRILDVLATLVPKPWRTVDLTNAATFRQIEKYRPTLLLDEADNIDTSSRRSFIALLNGAHSRDSAFVSRSVGDDHEPTDFNTYAPKAVAGLRRFFPETTWSRAIVILMKPKGKTHTDPFVTAEVKPLGAVLASEIARWVDDHRAVLTTSWPGLPASVTDRRADNWRPFIAIADMTGPEWGTQARQAAVEDVDKKLGDISESRRLLAHVRQIFIEKKVDRLQSKQLCTALNDVEEWPWGHHNGAEGIRPYQVSKLLDVYDIGPESVYFKPTVPGGTAFYAKGYTIAKMQEAFEVHLDDPTDDGHMDVHDGDDPSPDITDIPVILPPPDPDVSSQ